MLRKWIAAHRSLVATATSCTIVGALVVAVAVVSTGYTAQRLDLNDASVWVTNNAEQSIGRANTAVLELNTVVAGSGNDLDVLQSGSTVLTVDRANAKVDIVDAATSTVTDSVPLPPNRPEVYLAGQTAVVLSRGTGELWIVPLPELASFDAQSPPTLSLGAGAVASMDDAGLMFVYSPTTRQVFRIDPQRSDAALGSDKVSIPASATVTMSSVAGRWAILSATGPTLYVPGHTINLSTRLVGAAVIQQASSTGNDVLVADSTRLVRVPLDGTAPVTVSTAGNGPPARPLVANGCEFAAWSGGSAWRGCANDGALGHPLSLSGVPAASSLSFRANGNRVVLNDAHAGASWAVQDNGQLIDNWADLIAPKDQHQQQQQNNEDTPPQLEKAQLPPVAINDDLGARPGRASVLPVLLNDYDPNGDVLVISDVTSIDPKVGRVDLINDRQQLQLTLTSTASGSVSFRYSITDGRGGTATATVIVTVKQPDENGAPHQVRTSKTIVVAGGRVTTQVLGDWVDPDGDPFYLTSASVAAPDEASYKPQGSVIFSDSGRGSSLKSVALVVSDGTDEGTGSLAVTVRDAGQVPIIADPFVVLASSGQEVTVSPLEHVRGGSATIRLNSVPAKTGVTVTPSYEAGTFRFLSTQVGTHYLDYVVTDGDLTATGQVRVDVIAPPDANAQPITIPKTIFVHTLSTQRIDVAGTDIDPAGGVLLVTGIQNLPAASGVTAEILEQRLVRVSLRSPLNGPISFNYTISNGLASAQGVITVVEIPTPTHLQPPVANDDSVTVRVGAAIDIPVLDNDEQPDGEDLTLVPTLAQNVPDGAGLLFASGKVLRYLAPQRPGNYTAVYEVRGPDGQASRAQVKIAVREKDVNTNNPPVPSTVTARVLAGETVNIKIPLGIDPDGDSVQLIGQETNPDKGSVTAVGADYITYRAGDYSAGTDTFTYTVSDALGARATGTVRVGISARLDGARNPIAVLDQVTVRPGVSVSVQVLANDSDPDGSPLHIVSAVPNDAVTKATISGDLVTITPPVAPGDYGVVYTIGNDKGGTSSNFVRVTVDPKAPLAQPVAGDTVLTLTDILGRTTIDVNVLANVFFADGSPSTLGVSIYPGFSDSAQVLPNKRIQVTVKNESQIIPFKVTHPDDPKVFSYAFIWVPGFADALPQLNHNARPLSVTSGDPLTIRLNDYVLAVGGKKVRLTDTNTVRATHSDGTSLVMSPDTLTYTSAPKYFGPASISFEVTDGSSATDPNGRTSILVLPITVLPRDNQPPAFGGGVIEFEPAQEKDIDLVKLTNYPYKNDLGQLAYTVLNPLPIGFTYALDGQHLKLRANEAAISGSTTSISLGVRDQNATGEPGRITLVVVPSTRPLARPAPDLAAVRRGDTTTIDVLANDRATNPFPGKPLSVIAIRGIDGKSLPAGVAVTPSADKSKLTVSVSTSAEPIDSNFQYEVADATGNPDRYVWGSVRISVQDRPDPVTNVHVTDFGDRKLTLAWSSGPFNNSPITGYQVTETNAGSGSTVSTTDCGGSQCTVTTPGNGPDNAVRFAVTAKNGIGTSDPTSSSGTSWSDVIPAPPTALTSSPLDHGLKISWTKPADTGGSPITKYVLTVEGTSPVEVTVPGSDPVGTDYSRSITDGSIENGSNISFSVSARNAAPNSLANWNRSSGIGHPAGAPIRQGAPDASASTNSDASATLSWDGAFSSNGRSISDYYAAIFTGDPPTCGVTGDLPGTPDVPANSSGFKYMDTSTSTTFTGLTANTTYSFAVFAFNGMGCTRSAIVQATPRVPPGTVTGIATSGPDANGSSTWDFRVTDVSIANGPSDTDSFMYRLSGGNVEGGEHGPLQFGDFLVASNGSQYGEDISVQVKACKTYPEGTVCSQDWSNTKHLGVPVNNSVPRGLSFTHDPYGGIGDPPTPGAWSWDASPDYPNVTYSCGDGENQLDNAAGGSCEVTETRLFSHDFPNLNITITANGTTYVRTYDWHDYN